MPRTMTTEEYIKEYGQEPTPNSTDVKRAVVADSNAQRGDAFFPADASDSPLKAGAKSLGNVPKSAFDFAKNIGTAILNPIDTTKGVANAITGGGRVIQRKIQDVAPAVFGDSLPENQNADATFNALKDSIVERYGSLEKAQKTATNDPIGFGADVVAIFSGASKIPAVASATNRVSGLANKARGAINTVVTQKFDRVAVSQMTKALDLNPTDTRRIKQLNVYGGEPANFMLEKGIKGSQESMIAQLDDLRFNSKASVDDGLAQLQKPVSGKIINSAHQTLDSLIDTFDGTIGNEPFVKELQTMRNQNAYTLTEMNEIKRMAQSQLDVYKSTGVLKDSAKAKGLNNVISDLKTTIEDQASLQGFEDVKALNKDTQVSREIRDSISKRLEVTGKANLPLRDAIIGAGGFATGSAPLALGVIVSRRVLESSQFRTYLGNKLSSESPQTVSRLQKAINDGNYNEVILYLSPVINEFEASQEEPQP